MLQLLLQGPGGVDSALQGVPGNIKHRKGLYPSKERYREKKSARNWTLSKWPLPFFFYECGTILQRFLKSYVLFSNFSE